ncbi:MAG: deoxyguanosinetriphosphate triphosphohydrolase [Candidatus Solibacter sp.]|nr:deoxyguanosinetriphosphate triphosphohydrolase [Candidatus Solibacter sp.]
MSLVAFRFPVDRLAGRRYPEAPHPFRNEFQRDRDRIVHARAFRRLEDKTQVFGEGVSDHFRNRLTHTIEVSQIARTAASALGLDEDFTEALALAHDIGHPPFAHAGEEALNAAMSRFGDCFDHNLHALRIVEYFESRYARFPGLNLTFEVREGMVKHSRDFEPGERPGFDEYLPGLKPPLEAQLIDLADEIAYNSADLDDGYSAGLFDLEQIATSVPGYGLLLHDARTRFPHVEEGILFQETLRKLIDLLASGLIDGTRQAVLASGCKDVGDVRRCDRRLAEFMPEPAAVNRHLKDFLLRRVYSIEPLQVERRRASEAIWKLFDHYMESPHRLPNTHRERTAGLPLHRVVCDYVAGMTDGFFRRTLARELPPDNLDSI